jgi:hypothetical protein
MLEVNLRHTPRRLRWWFSFPSCNSLWSGISALNTLGHNSFLERRVIDVFKGWITLDLINFGFPFLTFFTLGFIISKVIEISSGSFERHRIEILFFNRHIILVNFLILLIEVIFSWCKQTLAHLLVLNLPSSWSAIIDSCWCVLFLFIKVNPIKHMLIFVYTWPKLFILNLNLFNIGWALNTNLILWHLNCLQTFDFRA